MTGGFVQVSIRADPAMNEDLVGILSQIGFEGYWEDNGLLRCFMKSERWSDELAGEIGRVLRMFSAASRFPQPTYSVTTLENRNWNEEWEKTVRPVRIGRRIVVSPSWHNVKAARDQIVLIIDPKMSFGTGTHESTRLIMVLLEKELRPGTTLLDVGTGTGILAIAGIKLGARCAIAVDPDEWAYRNSLENAARNGVGDRLTIVRGELNSLPHEHVDLITANIQLDVLTAMLDELTGRLVRGGTLLLSGLLQEDLPSITSSLERRRFAVQETLTENEWVAIAACQETGK